MTEEDPNFPPTIIVGMQETCPVFVDWFLSAGQTEGIVNLSLGTLDPTPSVDGGQAGARIFVASKLRMSVGFAERLHKLLGDMLADARAGNAAQDNEDLL